MITNDFFVHVQGHTQKNWNMHPTSFQDDFQTFWPNFVCELEQVILKVTRSYSKGQTPTISQTCSTSNISVHQSPTIHYIEACVPGEEEQQKQQKNNMIQNCFCIITKHSKVRASKWRNTFCHGPKIQNMKDFPSGQVWVKFELIQLWIHPNSPKLRPSLPAEFLIYFVWMPICGFLKVLWR